MQTIISVLCWWAVIGYFICGAIPKVAGRTSALKQMFWLGPFFWVGIGLIGLVIFIKRKFAGS